LSRISIADLGMIGNEQILKTRKTSEYAVPVIVTLSIPPSVCSRYRTNQTQVRQRFRFLRRDNVNYSLCCDQITCCWVKKFPLNEGVEDIGLLDLYEIVILPLY